MLQMVHTVVQIWLQLCQQNYVPIGGANAMEIDGRG